MFRRVRSSATIFVTVLALASGIAGATASTNAAVRAEQAYLAARSHYETDPKQPDAAIAYAKACSDRAEAADEDAERARFAREGITAARSLLKMQRENAAAHYYLAVNLGELAETKKAGALSIVKEIESELLTALRLDGKIDYAGPDRCLGMLYCDAPGWPLSVGSRNKARQHLLHAIQLFPNYPDNRLCQIEAALKWGDCALAQGELAKLKTSWPLAKSLYAGNKWDSDWSDWELRVQAIEAKLGETKRELPARQR